MKIEITVKHIPDAETAGRLRRIESFLSSIDTDELELTMQKIDDILADVRESKTLIAGLKTYQEGLRQQIKDALANSLSPEDQAKLDEILTSSEENRAELASSLVAQTPAANVDPNASGPPST